MVFECWKLAVSMTTPAIRFAAIAPSAAVERHAECRQQQGNHFARCRRGRVDPVDDAEAGVRHVMVDVDDRQPAEELRVLLEHGTDALELAAVTDHDEVVVDIGIRFPAHPRELGQEVVHGGHGIRAQRGRLGTQRFERQRDAERRAERVGLRVAVADGEHATRLPEPAHELGRDGGNVRLGQ